MFIILLHLTCSPPFIVKYMLLLDTKVTRKRTPVPPIPHFSDEEVNLALDFSVVLTLYETSAFEVYLEKLTFVTLDVERNVEMCPSSADFDYLVYVGTEMCTY